MVNNIKIPLNSTLDMASYDVTVPDNEVAFSTKETIQYRNCLSNLRSVTKEGITTTAGANIHIDENSNLKYNDIDLGFNIQDEHTFLMSKKPLPKNFPGDFYGSYYNGEINCIVIFSEDNAQYYTSYFDKDNNKLLKTETYSKKESYGVRTFGMPVRASYEASKSDIPQRYYHFELSWKNDTSLSAKVVSASREGDVVTLTKSEAAVCTFESNTDMNGKESKDFTYMGKTRDALVWKRWIFTGEAEPNKRAEEQVFVAFDDIDQRKRGTFNFTVTTKEDGTLSVVSNPWQPYYKFFGTIGTYWNGKPVLTGEPMPIRVTTWHDKWYSIEERYYPYYEMSNGVIAWSIVDKDHKPNTEYTSEGDVFKIKEKGEADPDNTAWKSANHKRSVDKVVWTSGITINQDGQAYNIINGAFKNENTSPIGNANNYVVYTPYTYDLGNNWKSDGTEGYNPFPTGTVFTNITENKGKYWDYGNGWAKSLNFGWALYQKKDIVTLPLTVVDGTSTQLYQIADPMGLEISHTNVTNYSFTDNDDDRKWHRVVPEYQHGMTCRLHRFNKGAQDALIKNKEWVTFTNTIGGNNAKGWIMSLPFTVPTENEAIKTIWYNGLKTGYTSKSTLLTTPGGDEVARPYWIGVTEDVSPEYTYGITSFYFIDGYYMYQITHVADTFFPQRPEDIANFIKIDKVSDYLYRFNILNERNLLKELPDGSFDFVPGFLGWAMETSLRIKDYSLLLPPDGSDVNDIFSFASGYNQELKDDNPVTSFLFPAITLPFYLDESDTLYFNKTCLDLKKPILAPAFMLKLTYDTDFIDVYYNHSNNSTQVDYQYSTTSDTAYPIKYFDVDKRGFQWATSSTEILFPMGLGSEVKASNFITPTIQLSNDYSVRLFNKNNQTFLSFNIANRTYRGQAIFTIYGGNYTYDGQGIYYIGSGNDYSQSQFVCYALGLKFLANSGSEAYFYSPWEKRLFLFTGSNTLQAAESYSSLGDVIDSLFSSNEQALYLLFDNLESDKNTLLIRTPDDAGSIDIDPGFRLESSANGCILSNNQSNISHAHSLTVSPHTGTPLPFNIETEYIGDSSMLYKFPYIDILLLDNNKNVNFDVTFNVINGIKRSTETKHIELTDKDWKGKTYRYTFTPINMMGESFKLGIHSDTDIYIGYIGVGVDDISNNPVGPRTRGK